MSEPRPASLISAPGPARAAVALGWARVRAAGWSVLAAYLLSLGLALPLAAVVQASLRASLEHREAAERLLHGWDGLWHHTFAARASGLLATFDAGIVGIGAVLRSLDALLRGALLELPAPIVAAGLLYLLGWVLLSGGLLARFGGDDRGLVRLGVRHLPRLLAVAAVGWLGAWLVLAEVLPLLSAFVERQCRDVIDERVHAAWLLGKYAVVWLLMLALRVWIDYAKIAAVADPGRSAWAALREGWAVISAQPGAVVGVRVLLGLVGLGLLLAYWALAPGPGQSNAFKIAVAFVIGQSSVVARVVMRAWTLASEQALARGRVSPARR
ncbi:MAG: hypothetical protein KDK70_17965 [Myxococcales bacterium]|nr:hypothetical protein [Myxococcales bacterium]